MQSRVDTMASQGHRRPRFLLPFCSSILVCGFLDHDHKLSGLRQCHDRLLHEGKIQKKQNLSRWHQLSFPLRKFPSNLFHQPLLAYHYPYWGCGRRGVTQPSLATGSLEKWVFTWSHYPPPQTDKISVNQKEKKNQRWEAIGRVC